MTAIANVYDRTLGTGSYSNNMNRIVKEGEGRKASNNLKDAPTHDTKGNAPQKDVKQYLPSFAFSKTVKSSTTKSLLKFRERQELQKFKKAQQYKSYQRVMKREGYETNHHGQKRHRDDFISGENGSDANFENDTMAVASEPNTKLNMSTSESALHTSDKNTHEAKQKSQFIFENKQESIDTNTKLNTHEHSSMNGGGGVLQDTGKQNHPEKWNKKRKQQEEEQRRADEYKQRQIQAERDKKKKLKQRQERHRLLSARTSRGQPIMKNIALDILNKLQREQQQDASSSKLR